MRKVWSPAHIVKLSIWPNVLLENIISAFVFATCLMSKWYEEKIEDVGKISFFVAYGLIFGH